MTVVQTPGWRTHVRTKAPWITSTSTSFTKDGKHSDMQPELLFRPHVCTIHVLT